MKLILEKQGTIFQEIDVSLPLYLYSKTYTQDESDYSIKDVFVKIDDFGYITTLTKLTKVTYDYGELFKFSIEKGKNIQKKCDLSEKDLIIGSSKDSRKYDSLLEEIRKYLI